jgi:hypothetical protein
MLKETIKYVDYNGIERTEDFYFNLSETEIIEMASTTEGDLAEELKKMVESKDGSRIMKTFKDLVARAYGEKSADGRRFVKSPEISKAFFETEAYNKLFMRLVTEPEYAANFIAGIIPQEVKPK